MKKSLSVLLVLMLAGLSGCVDPDAVLTLEEMNNTTEVAESSRFEIRDSSDRGEPVWTAINNGTSDRTVRNISVEEPDLYFYKGKYYDLSREESNETEVIIAEFNISETTDRAQYSIEDVTKKDAIFIREYRGFQDNLDKNERERRSTFAQRYALDEINNSILLQEGNKIISYDGTNYSVSVSKRIEKEQDTYTYNSELRYNSSETYGQDIISRYVFTLDRIPGNGTDVWNEALNNGGYYGQDSEGFKDIKSRFMQEDAYQMDEYSGIWYVRYGGNLYRAKLDWISD